MDPWLVSQMVVQNTERLCPLVAVQPIYMHPYTVAKMVATLAYLYGRRLYLNMVAGGFKNDLQALDDPTRARPPLRPPGRVHDDHQRSCWGRAA